MIAEQLISPEIRPLQLMDSGEEALLQLNDFYLRHLPLVEGNKLKGLISEDDLLDADPAQPISSYTTTGQPVFVYADAHFYDVMRILGEHQLTVIPVVDQHNNYAGLITLETLIRFFAKSGAFTERGSIVVLEMGRHDYSLAEIARIVESEGSVVLSSFLQTFQDSQRIEVTLKLNTQQVASIIGTFERYKYQVKASFNEIELQNALRERYESLMTYLNV